MGHIFIIKVKGSSTADPYFRLGYNHPIGFIKRFRLKRRGATIVSPTSIEFVPDHLPGILNLMGAIDVLSFTLHIPTKGKHLVVSEQKNAAIFTIVGKTEVNYPGKRIYGTKLADFVVSTPEDMMLATLANGLTYPPEESALVMSPSEFKDMFQKISKADTLKGNLLIPAPITL